MAEKSGVITIKATADEADSWRQASGGNLSAWVRKVLNDALKSAPRIESSVDISAMVRDAIDKALASKGLSEPEVTNGYIPTLIEPAPPGARTMPVNPDTAERYRERGKVAAFLRLDGREWPHPGPDPLHRGCKVRKDVLAEFQPKLEALRERLAEERAQMANGGP